MTTSWTDVATTYWNAQPSPHNPQLTNGEFPMFVKLATKAKFGGHATAHEAGLFATEFKSMNANLAAKGKDAISPEEFGHLLDRIAPTSFAFHGRPPTMQEIVRHRDSEPSTIQKFYSDLPDQHYPHVTAGQMAKALSLAEEPAVSLLGRKPVKLEAARFAMGNLGFSDIIDYYQGISGLRPSTEGAIWTPPPGGFGAPPEGSQQPEPRTLPPLGPWIPRPGGFGAPRQSTEGGMWQPPIGGFGGHPEPPGAPPPNPIPPLGPWTPEPGTFGAPRKGGEQE